MGTAPARSSPLPPPSLLEGTGSHGWHFRTSANLATRDNQLTKQTGAQCNICFANLAEDGPTTEVNRKACDSVPLGKTPMLGGVRGARRATCFNRITSGINQNVKACIAGIGIVHNFSLSVEVSSQHDRSHTDADAQPQFATG